MAVTGERTVHIAPGVIQKMGIKKFLFAAICMAVVCAATPAQVPGMVPELTIEDQTDVYLVGVTGGFANWPTYLFLSSTQDPFFLDLGAMGGVQFNILAPIGFRLGFADGNGDIAVTLPKVLGLDVPYLVHAQAVSFHYYVRGSEVPEYNFQFAVSDVVSITLKN